jgi:hypothetical protein
MLKWLSSRKQTRNAAEHVRKKKALNTTDVNVN